MTDNKKKEKIVFNTQKKTCSICNINKSIANFNKKGKGKTLKAECKACCALRHKKYYIENLDKIKGYTSKTLREEYIELKSKLPCLWTRSSFISTVGSVSLEVVKKYIENQKNV